jgi:hypothetical protein
MQPKHPERPGEQRSPEETVRVRDEAVRRALNTPPKPYKDNKAGKAKPKPSQSTQKR